MLCSRLLCSRCWIGSSREREIFAPLPEASRWRLPANPGSHTHILVQSSHKKTLISTQNPENKGSDFSYLLDLWFLRYLQAKYRKRCSYSSVCLLDGASWEPTEMKASGTRDFAFSLNVRVGFSSWNGPKLRRRSVCQRPLLQYAYYLVDNMRSYILSQVWDRSKRRVDRPQSDSQIGNSRLASAERT